MKSGHASVVALLVAAAMASPVPAAPLDEFVRICGDQSASPREVSRFCQRALDSGRLSPRQAALVQVNLGIAQYDLGNNDAAIAAYSAAIAVLPELVPALVNRARAYERAGLVRQAVEDYGRVLQMDPGEPDAYLGRGTLMLKHGQPGQAVADLSQVVALRPDWVSAYFNRGLAELELGDWAAADRDFSTVLARAPNDAGAHLNRGRARAALQRVDAVEDFDRAVELRPEWAGAWFARGQYHDRLGACEQANGDFRRAYDLGYSDPWLVNRMQNMGCR